MPLIYRSLASSVLFIFTAIIFNTPLLSQTPATTPQAQPSPTPRLPSAGEIMRERISKAKAYIAVRNYTAAIYELENIKRESNDTSVLSVVNVLLMNSYLEQGNYPKAQTFLNDAFAAQKANKPNSVMYYSTVSAQVVRVARQQLDRYKALGLSPNDRSLPLEATNDLEKMRETLEIVITQNREIGKDPARSSSAMALLEEASTSRSMIARDDYDAKRWRDEISDTREQMASSNSQIIDAVSLPPIEAVAQNNPPTVVEAPPVVPPPAPAPAAVVKKDPEPQPTLTAEQKVEMKPVETEQQRRTRVVGNAPVTESVPETVKTPEAASNAPMSVGSLVGYAVRQAQPSYPPAARNMRATGVVRVEVMIDEEGEVADVISTRGPSLLQSAAKEAILKWRFKPFVRDGQPVKAVGFVSFNFSL